MSVTRRSFEVISVTSDYAGTLASQSGCSSQGNSSQPSSSSLLRSSSRFRVIRLATGRAEPYSRGRWTCRDFLESEEGAGLRRMMESMRHAHSLESLDIIRQLPLRKGEGLHVLAQRPIKTDMRPFRGLQPIRLPLLDSIQPIEDSALPPRLLNIPVLQLDTNAQSERVCLQRPEDGLFNPGQTVSILDHTMFSISAETSDAGLDLNTIDTKIQQAMDLVKSHLQLAIREEMAVLQQQIRDLQDKNNQLQRENYTLRSLLNKP
ncbi:unnamed protein product [Boreogadus saida]